MAMKNGKWFFLFKMKISGEDALNETVEYEKKVKIELFALTEPEALSQANYNIEEIKAMGQSDLKKYCDRITSEDAISFSDFQISYEKKLDNVKIPDLFM
jgi:hypothetical protein